MNMSGRLAGRRGASIDCVDLGGVKTGAGARGLVRQIYRTILAYEVFVPAHPAVWSCFPGFAAQATSVHHDHGRMLIGVERGLILHIHLVDGDVAFNACARPGRAAGSAFLEVLVSPPTKKLP